MTFVEVSGPERRSFSLSSSDGPASILTAGDAGIVLKRFFPPTTPALRREEANGLEAPRAGASAVGREPGMAGPLLLLDGLSILERSRGLSLVVGGGCKVDLLSGVAETVLAAVARLVVVVPDNDIFFAGPPIPIFFLSSVDEIDISVSSIIGADGRGL